MLASVLHASIRCKFGPEGSDSEAPMVPMEKGVRLNRCGDEVRYVFVYSSLSAEIRRPAADGALRLASSGPSS